MNLSQIIRERITYSTFDLLSDIGGLSGMLGSILAFLMKIWNYNSADNFMVTQLFKFKRFAYEKEDRIIKYSMR